MRKPIITCLGLLTLLCAATALQQEAPQGEMHVDREHGYCFRFPDADWRILQDQVSQGAQTLIAQNPKSGGFWVVVTAPGAAADSLAETAKQRVELQARGLGVSPEDATTTDIEHEGVAGIHIVISHGDPESLLCEWVFVKDEKLFLLQSRYRADSAELVVATEALVASFSWSLPAEDEVIETPADQPLPPEALDPLPIPPRPELRIVRGTEGRIVLVRSCDDFELDARLFAAALPASRVGDAPVCLLVGDSLTISQVDLLNRLPAAEIVAVGEPPAEVAPFVTLTRPPNPDPPTMLGSRIQEDGHGTEAAHRRTDHPQVA